MQLIRDFATSTGARQVHKAWEPCRLSAWLARRGEPIASSRGTFRARASSAIAYLGATAHEQSAVASMHMMDIRSRHKTIKRGWHRV